MTNKQQRLTALHMDPSVNATRSKEVVQEQQTALKDLLAANVFYPMGEDGTCLFVGPYSAHLSIVDNRMHFDIEGNSEQQAEVILPISPFRSVVKDYFMMCESYYSAIAAGKHAKLEAIDMGRRGVHDEGSTLLQELLEGKIFIDFPTARRLFTLLCVMHIR